MGVRVGVAGKNIICEKCHTAHGVYGDCPVDLFAICEMKNDTRRGEKRKREAEGMPGGCWLVTPRQAGSRQQVEAAAAVGVGGGEGRRTKSCMSSRVVVVSIKPIIIANAYASLSAKELRVFPAKPGEDWQCLQGGEGGVRCLVGATVVV